MFKRAFLIPTLLLLGCSAPTPTPSAPPTASTGQVYALDIRVGGPQGAQATLQALRPAKLTTQRLEGTPGDVQLGAQAISTVTFVSRRGTQDVRHVNTTFLVTNPTGAPITNLVLLPVALTDTDGDPGNNAVAPTIAGTPFRRLQLFGGQDASAQAPQLSATRAQDLDLVTGVARPHPQGTPFLPGLDLRGVQVTPPAGLTVTTQSGGWLMPGTLAPGASVPVTFAVDFPVDRQHPETQVFSFSLLFTPAQDATGSEVGGPTDPARVVGTLHHPVLGQGARVEEQYLDFDLPGSGLMTAQSVPLAADGQVDFMLSTPPAGALSSLFMCQDFVGDRSQPDALAVQANLQVIGAQDDPLGQVGAASLEPRGLIRLYVDRDIRVQGTCDYPPLDMVYQDRLELRRGWNWIQQRSVGAGDASVIQRTSVPVGTWSRLTFLTARPWVSVVSPAWDSGLLLRAGQSTAVPFGLRQGGGISGPVTLKVDVPGVTVSPATLNLPSLTGQGGGAQALQTTLSFHADTTVTAGNSPLTLTFLQDGRLVGYAVSSLTVTH